MNLFQRLAIVAAGGVAGAFFVRSLTSDPEREDATASSSGAAKNRMLAAALRLLPGANDRLDPSDPAIDAVYGGRRTTMFGAPAWRYFQTKLDASGRKGGSTCAIVAGYLASLAGWPRALINRAPDDPWAPGAGFVPGQPMSKMIGGAKKLGLYLPAPVVLRPGDVFHVDHPPKPNSDHVGVVLSVAGDERSIETLDGGQGAGALIKRNVRQVSADGRTITLDGAPARLLGVVRGETSVVA